jgi:hypothetical protein
MIVKYFNEPVRNNKDESAWAPPQGVKVNYPYWPNLQIFIAWFFAVGREIISSVYFFNSFSYILVFVC